MIPIVLSFLLGICILHFPAELPSISTSLIIVLILFFFIFLICWTSDYLGKIRRKFAWIIPNKITIFGMLLALVLGYFWMWFHIYVNLTKRLPVELEGKPVQVVGIITGLPELLPNGVRFEFQVKHTIPETSWTNPGKIMLSYYEPRDYSKLSSKKYDNRHNSHNSHDSHDSRETLHVTKESFKVGDEWQLWIKLKKPRGYSNPGSFDKEKYYFQNRWQAQGKILLKLSGMKKSKKTTVATVNKEPAENRETENGKLDYRDIYPKRLASDWFSFPIDRLRDILKQKINHALEGKVFAPLISALVLGIREGITQDQWRVFRDTGTAHLMAISGLHVGLVAGLIYFVMQWVWRLLPSNFLRIPATYVAALDAIIGAFIYALLAGFSIPTQRACIMITLLMSGMLQRRMGNAWRAFFLALALVLIWDPFSTLSIGFWLSFTAVGVMLYGLKGRLNLKNVWWKWGRAQWVVFLGLMPLCLASFNQISLVAPFANIIAIPWVSFTVVPTALLGTGLLLFSDALGIYALNLAESTFGLLWPFLNFLSQHSKATWSPGVSINHFSLIFAFFACLILLVPRGFPGRWLGLVGLFPLFFAKPLLHLPAHGTAIMTLLDVGQGLSAVLQTKNHVLLFDTGPKFGEGSDTGSSVVLPFLKNSSIKKIDTVVISHGDNDHIGGLQSLLKNGFVGRVLTSEKDLVQKLGATIPIIACHAGQHWHWDGVDFEMLHPETLHTGKRNDHCCVLKVSAGQQSVLFTGDIELQSEKKLLEHYAQYPEHTKKLASTILIVPHHGSKTSSCLEFIQAVNPAYALIPVGYLNPYGHPKFEITERYRARNILILDNIQSGAISFMIHDQKKLESPEQFRKQYQRLWQWDFNSRNNADVIVRE